MLITDEVLESIGFQKAVPEDRWEFPYFVLTLSWEEYIRIVKQQFTDKDHSYVVHLNGETARVETILHLINFIYKTRYETGRKGALLSVRMALGIKEEGD